VLSIDPVLDERLNQQFDLARVEVAPGIEVYENLARLPIRSVIADDGVATGDAPVADPAAATAWPVTGRPPVRFDGRLPSDRTLLALTSRDDGWRLRVGGSSIAPKALAGWASRYDVKAGGRAELSYSTPASQVLLHVVQLLVLISLPWARRRRVSEFRVRQARSRARVEEPA